MAADRRKEVRPVPEQARKERRPPRAGVKPRDLQSPGLFMNKIIAPFSRDCKLQFQGSSEVMAMGLSSRRRPLFKRHRRLWPGNHVPLFY